MLLPDRDSPLSFNSFDRSYKLGKGDVVGGGGLFQ